MKTPLAIAIFLVLIVCHTCISRGTEKLTYADGYRDGKQAVREDVRRTPNLFWKSHTFATVPNYRLQQIKDKPETYQRGFVKGYKEGAEEALVSSPRWWGGFTTSFIISLGIAMFVIVGMLILVL